MAEYRRGQGPNALPQGAATSLNEAQPDLDALALENMDVPVQYGKGDGLPIPDDDSGVSDDLSILLAPPNPNYTKRVLPKERQGRVPKYVVRHLPQFRAAATAPDAPPTLRALYNATLRQLEEERRRGA